MTKMHFGKSIVFLVLIILISHSLFAQSNTKEKTDKEKPTQVELITAGELEMITEGGQETRYLRSNDSLRVVFKQDDMTLNCSGAIHFPDSNFVFAYGDVLFLKGDSITLTGDTLFYYGNEKVAEVWSNITFSDSQMVLTTDQLDYDLNQNLASYQFGGTITDDSTTLTSKKGYYNTQTKIVAFSEDVVLDNPLSEYHLESDTLTYSTTSKIAYFHAKTEITTRDGKLIAESGQYDSQLSKSIFKENARIENETYVLAGDFIDYDEVLERGIARGNVRLLSKEDTTVIYGDKAFYFGLEGRTEILGNALVEKPFGENDTLFVLADTLISINDSIADTRMIYAYPQVKILANDMQGICDSLIYDLNDSSIHFFVDPVLWAQTNQLEADTILAQLKGNALDKLLMKKNSFITSKDSLKNFNQIKGRDMDALFRQSNIRKVDVNGNAESIYFATEEDTVLIGMNRMDCSNMIMHFSDSNQLQTITSIKQIDAKFIPPHELKASDTKLKNFNWRSKERPKRFLVENYFSTITRMNVSKYLPKDTTTVYQVKDSTITTNIQNFGDIVLNKQVQLYMNQEQLTFYQANFQPMNRRGKYYVDFFPVNPTDLPDKFQRKGFQTVEFEWKSTNSFGQPAQQVIALPPYPVIILRVGQYEKLNNKRSEIWAEAINLF